MYFGTLEVLERALDGGEVKWEDVVRNVEYLGMRQRVRRFLDNWYAVQRGLPVRPCKSAFALCGSEVDEEETTDDDNQDVFSESDCSQDDDEYSDMSDDDEEDGEDSDRSETDGSETLVDDEPLSVQTKFFSAMDMDDEPPRGRSRTRISPTAAMHSPIRRL